MTWCQAKGLLSPLQYEGCRPRLKICLIFFVYFVYFVVKMFVFVNVYSYSRKIRR